MGVSVASPFPSTRATSETNSRYLPRREQVMEDLLERRCRRLLSLRSRLGEEPWLIAEGEEGQDEERGRYQGVLRSEVSGTRRMKTRASWIGRRESHAGDTASGLPISLFPGQSRSSRREDHPA